MITTAARGAGAIVPYRYLSLCFPCSKRYPHRRNKKGLGTVHDIQAQSLTGMSDSTQLLPQRPPDKRRRQVQEASEISPLKNYGLIMSDPIQMAEILHSQFCSAYSKEDLTNLPDLGPSSVVDALDIKSARQE